MGGIEISRDHPIISNPLKMFTVQRLLPFFTAKCGFKLDLQSKITILKLSHETLRDPLNHDFVELVLQKMVLIVGFLMGIHRD